MKAVVAGVASALIAAALAAAQFRGSVVSDEGDPISGATVTAYRCESEQAQLDRLVANEKRIPLAKATSDAKGAFTLDLQAHGIVVIVAEAPGFAPSFTKQEIDEPWSPFVLQRVQLKNRRVMSADGPVAGARVISVYEGGEWEVRSDEHGNVLARSLRVVALHPDFAPSNSLFLVRGITVTGTVVDANRKPVAGAHIRVDEFQQGVSAADGTFSIVHVDPSAQLISAETDDSFGFSSIKPKVTIVAKPTFTLSGVARDPSGRAVAGLRLTITGMSGSDAAAFTVTDATGAFAFRHLMPGVVSLYSGTEWLLDQTDLAVQRNTTRDITVTRTPILHGVVRLDDGRPVAGAVITELPIGFEAPPAETVTDAAGRFRVPIPAFDSKVAITAIRRGLAPTRTTLDVKNGVAQPELTLTIVKGIEVAGRIVDSAGNPIGEVTIMPHDLKKSLALSGSDGRFAVRLPEGDWGLDFQKDGYLEQFVNNIRIRPAMASLNVTMETGYIIRGHVRRKDGTPVGNAGVMIESDQPKFTFTDGDGIFELPNVAKGSVALRYHLNDRSEGGRVVVKVPSDDVAIVVPDTSTIRGRVVDTAGAPVTQFSVNANDVEQRISDDDGRFELHDAPVGNVVLTIIAEGFLPSETNVTAVASKSADAGTIALSSGRTVRGTVTSASGAPLAEVQIVVVERQVSAPHALSRQNGAYELTGIDSTETAIEYRKEGFVTQQRSVPAGEDDQTLNVQLAPGLVVTGHVVTAEGKPLANAAVNASSAVQGAGYETQQTDADGAFHFDSLVPGRYDFSATDMTTHLSGSVNDVDVASVHDVTIHLQPPTGAKISGTITGIDLTAVRGAAVTGAAPDGTSMLNALVDAEGNYRLDNVPLGIVMLYANASLTGRMRTSRKLVLEVAPNADLHADLAFSPLADIRGHVTRGGRPAGGVTLRFNSAEEWSESAAAISGDDGTFTVSLAEGSYQIDADGYRVEREVRAGTPLDIAIDTVSVSVTVIDAASDLPIAGAKVSTQDTPSPTHVTDRGETDAAGQITFDAPGTPQRIIVAKNGYATVSADGQTNPAIVKMSRGDGALVRLIDARDGSTLSGYAIARDAAGHVLPSSSDTGPDGTVRIAVAPGTYRFSGSAPEYGSNTVVAEVPAGEVQIPLRRGGKLLLVASGDLHATARLILPDGEEYVRCWCNGVADIRITGRITFVDSITPGSYTLEVTPDGGKPRTVPVSVMEGQTVTLTIQ